MTEPNSNVPDHHDPHGGVGSPDNVAGPNEFFDVSVDDYEQHDAENIMFNVEGNNDHPSRWGSRYTQFVNDPSQASPSGVDDQSGGQNAGYFDRENYAYENSTQPLEGVEDQSGGQNAGYFNSENYAYENSTQPLEGVDDQSGGQNAGYFDPKNYAYENSTQPLEWPVPSRPHDCSFCHVLRDIIHMKGDQETTKLEIHGRIGMICHGILEIFSGAMTGPSKECHMLDFCNKSISDVKEFLVKYFEDRTNAYYTMVDDPLLTFYEALCVRSDWDCVYGDNLQGYPGNIDTNQPEAQSDEVRPRKRTFKEQNDFVKNLTIKDIAKYFHLRENDAAKLLGVSTTTVKKISRNAGLERWPYRKVDAIARRTREIMSSTDLTDPTKKAEVEAELQRLQRKEAELYAPND